MKDRTAKLALIISIACLFLIGAVSGFITYQMTHTQKTYTLYIGTNDGDTYEPYDYEYARGTVQSIVLKYTSGMTMYDADGCWDDGEGGAFNEKSIVVMLADIDKPTVESICREINTQLNQNSILILTERSASEYFSER